MGRPPRLAEDLLDSRLAISPDLTGFFPCFHGYSHLYPSSQFPNRQNRQRVVLTSKPALATFHT